MRLHVVVGQNDKDEDVIEEFVGPQLEFLTEPSGVLLVLESPDRVRKAYAPGAWETVTRHAD